MKGQTFSERAVNLKFKIINKIYLFITKTIILEEGKKLLVSQMRKTIYQGKYLTMSTEKINGHLYERVSIRSGVRVLPIKNGKVLFIREFRKHEGRARLKLIGGWVDKENLTSLEIAQEELREEVSYQAGNWEKFYTYQIPNGTIEEKVDYFIARDLTKLPSQHNPDNDIVEEIVFLDRAELIEKLKKKEILWDKDMAVVLMFFESLS